MTRGRKSSRATPHAYLEDLDQLLQESQPKKQVYQFVDLSPQAQSVDQVDLCTNNDFGLSTTIVQLEALHVHLHRQYNATAFIADHKEAALGYSGRTLQENQIIVGRAGYKLQL